MSASGWPGGKSSDEYGVSAGAEPIRVSSAWQLVDDDDLAADGAFARTGMAEAKRFPPPPAPIVGQPIAASFIAIDEVGGHPDDFASYQAPSPFDDESTDSAALGPESDEAPHQASLLAPAPPIASPAAAFASAFPLALDGAGDSTTAPRVASPVYAATPVAASQAEPALAGPTATPEQLMEFHGESPADFVAAEEPGGTVVAAAPVVEVARLPHPEPAPRVAGRSLPVGMRQLSPARSVVHSAGEAQPAPGPDAQPTDADTSACDGEEPSLPSRASLLSALRAPAVEAGPAALDEIIAAPGEVPALHSEAPLYVMWISLGAMVVVGLVVGLWAVFVRQPF